MIMRFKKSIVMIAMMLICFSSLSVFAASESQYANGNERIVAKVKEAAYTVNENNFNILTDKSNISVARKSRMAYAFSDNPNASAKGQLTVENTMDMYYFAIADVNKFLLAQLDTQNYGYVAQLYKFDEQTGQAMATNVYGFSGDLIQLNGLPVGEYVL